MKMTSKKGNTSTMYIHAKWTTTSSWVVNTVQLNCLCYNTSTSSEKRFSLSRHNLSNITHRLQHTRSIVNVTSECRNSFENHSEHKVIYHRFEITDSEHSDLASGMNDCFDFIGIRETFIILKTNISTSLLDRALKDNENVLIHCAQGRSRSPSIVIGYLMRSKGLSFEAAFEQVKEARDYLQINRGFLRQLRDFETSLLS